MFHSQSHLNPREKYLAALAEAKAAEAEYLAAERLQQEEDSLRERLEQIQLLKQHPQPDFASYYTPPQLSVRPDLELLRRQIAAEERARIASREQQARELEALRRQAQQAREFEALRIHQARQAQIARDTERANALAAQRAHLAALTQRASEPPFRFVVSGDEDAPRPRRHHPRRPEPQQVQDLLSQLFGGRAEASAPAPAPAPAPPAPSDPAPQTVPLAQFLQHLLGVQPSTTPDAPRPQPAPKAAPQAPVTLEQLLNHFLGAAGVQSEQAQPSTSAVPPQAQPAQQQPAKQAASEAPITLEQLLGHFLGGAGVKTEQAESSTSAAAPAEKKEAAPAPSQAAPAPQPAAQTSASQATGWDHILSQLLGGGSQEVDLQQLKNMFLGGHPYANAPQPSSSKSGTNAPAGEPASLKQELEERARAQQSTEERDLAEAIRMSLAEPVAAPSSEGKGKAPAPAPVPDVASSTAEVKAIDASFDVLAADFAFPAELDFTTSRSASPTRDGAEPPSAISRLSYSARNHIVRAQHQALSALLVRLDAVDSFGDEGLRHARKEVVGRVEGALDELESVIEARWRKWAGKEERPVESAVPEPEPVATVPETTSPAALEAASPEAAAPESEPAAVADVEQTAESEAEPIPESNTIAPEPTTEASPAVEEPSYPPTAPDVASESVETIRPSEATASPAPSDIDTFLLPAASEPESQPLKKPASPTEEDVTSDWSEVDA